MAFHEYGGNGSGDVMISLPQWVLEIGKENQDIFFTDREGRRNTECLSWAIDKERVLKGRTGIEVFSSHLCVNIDLCPCFFSHQSQKIHYIMFGFWKMGRKSIKEIKETLFFFLFG